MSALLSAFVGCVLQGVVESKTNEQKKNILIYNSVSVSFNINFFTADPLIKTLVANQWRNNVTKITSQTHTLFPNTKYCY